MKKIIIGLGFKVCKKIYKNKLKLEGVTKFYPSAIDEVICDIDNVKVYIHQSDIDGNKACFVNFVINDKFFTGMLYIDEIKNKINGIRYIK